MNRQLLAGFGLSLVLHAVLAAPWVLGRWIRPPPPAPRQVVVDLFGMISHRQAEQQQAASEPPPAPAKPPPPAPAPPARPSVRKPVPDRKPVTPPRDEPGPVQVARPADAVEPPVAAPPAPPAPTAAQTQVQQTLPPQQESDAEQVRRYVGELRKVISANVVYPEEARASGLTGMPVIQFVVAADGTIRPGSLKIRQSSGSAALDDNALKAALASQPLPRPPREMGLAMAVAFIREIPPAGK